MGLKHFVLRTHSKSVMRGTHIILIYRLSRKLENTERVHLDGDFFASCIPDLWTCHQLRRHVILRLISLPVEVTEILNLHLESMEMSPVRDTKTKEIKDKGGIKGELVIMIRV